MALRKKREQRPRPRVGISVAFSPQTQKQEDFVRKIKNNVVSFGVGSPGTGKTLIAIATALEALLKNECQKIIVTRPTISSGPEIGFLPGTEEEKMAPFLVPIFDAFYKCLPKLMIDDFVNEGRIEIVSLSFVRGRNFENCYVVVDEAENLDDKSFYLLLTRICEGSKIIFCGDSSQIDLRNKYESGLDNAVNKFRNTPDFSVTEFGIEDCRRSRIVQDVIRAYFPSIAFTNGKAHYFGGG